MKIAIRSPNWIGDGVMCLPAIRVLREWAPDAELFLITKEYLADIYLNLPEVNKIIPIPDRLNLAATLRTARRLRQERFDHGILFTNSFHSALLFRLAGIRHTIGYDRDGRHWLLETRIPFQPGTDHHQSFYLEIVSRLTGHRITVPPPSRPVITREERQQASRLLKDMGIGERDDLIAISPVAAYGQAKAWLPERFAEVVHQLRKIRPDWKILIFGSAAERPLIERQFPDLGPGIFNLAGKRSLRQSILLLSRCRLLIGNDSGLMHIAAGLELPSVAIFGPTLPHKTAPLAGKFTLLYHPTPCAPCTFRRCPYDHGCMKAVSVTEVMSAAQRLLGRS